MANPYAGIITPELKITYDNAINALLEDTALTRPCRIEFGVTKVTECSNCIIDTINRCSANVYKVGGAIPFDTGSICPACNGQGLLNTAQTTSFNMAIIWNENRAKFIDLGYKIDKATTYAQTICTADKFPSLVKAKTVILDTTLEGFGLQKYERVGDPTPFTFGYQTYIFTLWSRVN